MWYGNKPVIEEGVLRIKEEHGYAKNYYFSDKHNFVLQVDIYPPTTCCVHVDISDYSIYLSPQGWGICRMDWDDCSGNIVSTNTKTQIILIVRGSQAGFYRKGTPVNYFENPGLSLNQVKFALIGNS